MEQKINLHSRLDVIIKYLFIKAYIEGNEYDFYEVLYVKHIKILTGGIEGNKKNIEDFKKNFIDLIESMKKNGFDDSFPIPINSSGDILNGAHRLACSLYFDITPHFKYDDTIEGYNWGHHWLKNNPFSQDEVLEILSACAKIEDEYTIVIIWPNIFQSPLKEMIEKNNIVIGDISIDLKSQKIFREFMQDIYSFDGTLGGDIGILEKSDYLSKFGNIVQVLLLKTNADVFEQEKQNYRKNIVGHTKIKDTQKALFYTFHSSDTKEEATYLSELIFNKNNLKYLFLRNFSENNTFLKRLHKLKKYLNISSKKKNEVCIVGSSSLEIFNLNTSSDIDIIEGKPENLGILKVGDDIDILDYQYSKNIKNFDIINRTKNFFYFRGFKFISLDLLQQIKQEGARIKDIQQAEKIENFLKGNMQTHTNLTKKIRLELKFLQRKILVYSLNACIYLTKKTKTYDFISFKWRKYFLRNLRYNSKNILIITSNYYPYPLSGGIVEQVRLLSESFLEKGYKVSILTRQYDKNLSRNEYKDGVNIYRYKNSFDFINFLVKNSDNYGVILSRQYYKNSFLLGCLCLLKIIQTKTIICTDSGGDNDEITKIKNKLSICKLYKLYFYIIGKNTYLNGLNMENIKHLKKIYPKKYHHKVINIYNGINLSKYKPKKIKEIKNILFLSRFEKEKGIFELITAFKQIQNNNITLHLIGYGNKKIEKEIQAMITKDSRIIYHGEKREKEKEKLISQSDLFIFPSYSEGQPVILTEIALKNIPIISTKVANNFEIYGKNISYVKKGDIGDLQNKIEWIIDNIGDYTYDYNDALKKIDINKITDSFIKLP